MRPDCIYGREATVIECKYFKNPVYQDVWYGFYVNLYDNEPTFKAIEKSDMTPALDARNFQAKQISGRDFYVQPDDNTVNTYSEWTFSIQPGIPMMRECYIKLSIPPEFSVKWDSIEASGIFLPSSLQNILSSGDFSLDQDSPNSITFFGCFDDTSLG
jgi:hypothetical protein